LKDVGKDGYEGLSRFGYLLSLVELVFYAEIATSVAFPTMVLARAKGKSVVSASGQD